MPSARLAALSLAMSLFAIACSGLSAPTPFADLSTPSPAQVMPVTVVVTHLAAATAQQQAATPAPTRSAAALPTTPA